MAWASASRASSTAALARLIDDQPGGEQLQRRARLSGKVCLSVTRVPMEYLSLFEAITEGRRLVTSSKGDDSARALVSAPFSSDEVNRQY